MKAAAGIVTIHATTIRLATLQRTDETLRAAASIPILLYPWPPLGDYINHLARMHVIATIGRDPNLALFYQVEWQIIPNLMMDLIVPILQRVMNVYLAGQVYTIMGFVLILSGTLALNRSGALFCIASRHRPCWERMGAWLVGETAGRPFPLPVLGRLSRAQSRMAAPSPFRREPSSIFRRLSEPSHFVPSCRGTAAASSTESGAGEPRIRAGALPFVGLRSLAVAT